MTVGRTSQSGRSHRAADPAVSARRRRSRIRGWRPALLIAWRTSWRHRGRTALIIALIALPVFAIAFLGVWFRTLELPADERATRLMGGADAIATVTVWPVIQPGRDGGYGSAVSEDGAEPEQRDPREVDLLALLPSGSRIEPLPAVAGVMRLVSGARSTRADVEAGAVGPLAAGLYRVVEGRLPHGPDEITVSPEIIERLGVGVGDEVAITDGDAAQIVGVAENPNCLRCTNAIAGAGTVLPTPGGVDADTSPRFLVDLPDGADPFVLWQDLARVGVNVEPRDAFLHPERYDTDDGQGPVAAAIAGVAATGLFGMLEIVLLAGTAFAVGARRQVRELGWISANGGTQRDVRRVVVAQGVVLGAVAGLGGVVLGALGVVGLTPVLEQLDGARYAGPVIRPLELLPIAAFGVLAAVLAATAPARIASRMPVMAALLGRYGSSGRRPLRRRLTGPVLIGVGGAVALGVSLRLGDVKQTFTATMRAGTLAGTPPPNGDYWEPPSELPYLAVMGVGICLLVAGIVLAAPALIGLAARVGGHLPLSARIALRDAGRHAHRTAPATCAIALVVGGTVALGFNLAGQEAETRSSYVAQIPLGFAELFPLGYEPTRPDDEERLVPRSFREAAEATAAALDADVVDVRHVVTEVAPSAWFGPQGQLERVAVLDTPPCDEFTPGACNLASPEVLAGSADELEVLTRAPLPASVRAVLEDGGAVLLGRNVVTSPESVDLGTYWAEDPAFDDPENAHLADRHTLRAVTLPVERSRVGAAFITEETARALGYDVSFTMLLLATDRIPTQQQEDRAAEIADAAGLVGFRVDRGLSSDGDTVSLVLAGTSGLLTIGGVAMAVGLAAAEGRADLATLGAVGAEPRRRRKIAMAQAGVVGGLGCGVGLLIGTFLATVAHSALLTRVWVVPWLLIGLAVVGVPALAVLVAGVFTRSRLPMVRRIAA